MSIEHKLSTPTFNQIQTMIGGIILLSQYSPLHQRYVLAEWQQRIMPSFELNQYCYYEDENQRPVAFCNWAFVSEENRRLLLNGERELIDSDWRSGSHIFMPEMIAPFGHAREVVNDLRSRVFAPWQGQKVCTVRAKVSAKNNRCIRKVQWFSI